MKVIGITGWKNSGKTTLTCALVNEFTRRGLRVSTVKHAHHNAQLDQPGTDSHAHVQSGASQVMLATDQGWSLVTPGPAPGLQGLLAHMAPCDLVVVEGYKNGPHPKIECYRQGGQLPLVAQSAENIRAVASDCGYSAQGLPALDLDDVAGIADFIWEMFDA